MLSLIIPKEYMIEKLKLYTKKPLQQVYKVKDKQERTIFISSTKRSGSTLLMEMIYTQPGVNYISQPLTMWSPRLYRNNLPHIEGGRYTTLSSDQINRAIVFLNKIIKGDIRYETQWDMTHKSYSWAVNRHVIKDLNSKPILQEIDDRMDIDVIYLVRHPLSCTMSVLDRGWESVAFEFVKDKEYIRKMLGELEIEFCRSIVNSGTKFERLFLEWCLENLNTLRNVHEREWLLLTYEELVFRPERISEWLSKSINLSKPGKMASHVNTPSKTTQEKSKEALSKCGPESLIKSRFSQASSDQKRSAKKILDTLNIEIYNVESPVPAPWATQFGDIEI